MIKHFLCAVLMMSAVTVFGQVPVIDWDPKPVVHTVAKQFSNESAVILEDDRQHQYVQDDKNGMYIKVSDRRLIKVNNDKGVEEYNKIYIPLSDDAYDIDIKARTIQPDGKVSNLSADKILDENDNGRHYKKFALEGVEKGSEIEYVYTYKRLLYFFKTEYFQSNATPYEKAAFTLICPDYLQFSVKGYNGFTVTPDTVINGERYVTGTEENVVALDDDVKYGSSSPYLANVQYKLSYNLNRDKNVRMFTWNEMAKNIYGAYTTYTDKEQKSINTFLKQMNLSASLSEEDKIVAVEDYIKTTISIDANAGDSKLEAIVKSKVANNEGVYKLFVVILDKLGIDYQMVYPSRRDELQLDEELENYDLANDLIFYFPHTGKYLQPTNKLTRYPYIDPYLAATKGIFLKGTTIGTFKTALAVFDSVAVLPYETNTNDLSVQIKFNETMDSLKIHSKQSITGYTAMSYRPEYSFLDKDKQDEFTKNILNNIGKSDSVINMKVQNTAMLDAYKNKPLIIEGDITSGELIEQAGNKLLVKFGDVIGEQTQLYQEKPRQLPIMIPYPEAEDREISFTIPDGYKIKNLKDLNKSVIDTANGVETMGFISTYTLTGNLLEVKLHEFYLVTDYPLNKFDGFKNVVDASADFNKIVLVLEKN